MHMAVAMTATFYGIFGANFLFLPVAGKLHAYSEQELFLKEVMIEGILSIQRQEVPAILTRRLQAYLNEGKKALPVAAREARA
jgi:chemotaxis protein MotA